MTTITCPSWCTLTHALGDDWAERDGSTVRVHSCHTEVDPELDVEITQIEVFTTDGRVVPGAPEANVYANQKDKGLTPARLREMAAGLLKAADELQRVRDEATDRLLHEEPIVVDAAARDEAEMKAILASYYPEEIPTVNEFIKRAVTGRIQATDSNLALAIRLSCEDDRDPYWLYQFLIDQFGQQGATAWIRDLNQRVAERAREIRTEALDLATKVNRVTELMDEIGAETIGELLEGAPNE